MTLFLIGLIGFFGLHAWSAVRSREKGRDLRERLGYGPFMVPYSGLSILFFALMVWAYSRMPDTAPLWTGPEVARTLSLPLNTLALILLVAAYTPVGHIKRAVHHPMMIATGIWALSHLWVGGGLAKILLFGSFALYAVLSVAMAFRRGERVTAAPRLAGDAMAVGIGVTAAVILLYTGHGHYF